MQLRFIPLELDVFMTIELGLYQNGNQAAEDLLANGFKLEEDIKNSLRTGAVKFSQEKILVDIFKMTTAELGFKDFEGYEKGPTRSDIRKRAEELGLSFLSPEMTLVFRRLYEKQRTGEMLYVPLSEPVVMQEGQADFFYIWRIFEDRPSLKTFQDRESEFHWDANFVWLLARVRK